MKLPSARRAWQLGLVVSLVAGFWPVSFALGAHGIGAAALATWSFGLAVQFAAWRRVRIEQGRAHDASSFSLAWAIAGSLVCAIFSVGVAILYVLATTDYGG